jgi:hypothetical protein
MAGGPAIVIQILLGRDAEVEFKALHGITLAAGDSQRSENASPTPDLDRRRKRCGAGTEFEAIRPQLTLVSFLIHFHWIE